jgi:hypothetical protein
MVIKMKKTSRSYKITFGAIGVILILISTVTAVPSVETEVALKIIDKDDTTMLNEFERFLRQIIEDESLQIEEEIQEYNIDIYKDFENLFDDEGFMEFLISDEFIGFLIKNLDDLLSDEAPRLLYNTDEMQEFIKSDEFIEFLNSDELQYVLDKLNENDDSEEPFSYDTSQNTQETQPTIDNEVIYSQSEIVYCQQVVNDFVNEEIEGTSSTNIQNVKHPILSFFMEFLISFLAVVLFYPALMILILHFSKIALEGVLENLEYWYPGKLLILFFFAWVFAFLASPYLIPAIYFWLYEEVFKLPW